MGESAHFRLFVVPDFDNRYIPADLQGSAGLDALETDWADKQTMLKMPEGERKIDYHLLTSDQINAGCLEKVGGCEVTGTLQIATNLVPDQHELMHAYMELVAPGANPVPFVVEGAAQAIGCEGLQVGVGRPGRRRSSWGETVRVRPRRAVCAVFDPDAGHRRVGAFHRLVRAARREAQDERNGRRGSRARHARGLEWGG